MEQIEAVVYPITGKPEKRLLHLEAWRTTIKRWVEGPFERQEQQELNHWVYGRDHNGNPTYYLDVLRAALTDWQISEVGQPLVFVNEDALRRDQEAWESFGLTPFPELSHNEHFKLWRGNIVLVDQAHLSLS